MQAVCEPLVAAKHVDPEGCRIRFILTYRVSTGWRTEDGDKLTWLTDGEPNDWPVILVNFCGEYERWDLSMTTFLVHAFSNQIECNLGRFRAAQRTFHRGRNEWEVCREIERTIARSEQKEDER